MPDIVYNYKNNLYINVTNRCPNNCEFCDIKKIGKDLGVDLILQNEPNFTALKKAIDQHISPIINEVVFCGGGEPLMRLDILLQIINYIKDKYSKQVRLDTSGYPFTFYIDRNVVEELKEQGLDSVSISVNSTDQKKYNKVCKPNLKDAYQLTIKFVKACKAAGIKTRITFVDYKIDRAKCKQLAEQLDVDYYIRSYSPI